MDAGKKSLAEIHISVLLFGLTGLFGKYVSLPASCIVLGRVFFASLSMGIFFIITGRNIKLQNRRDYVLVALLGAVLALHWTAFYTSVQLSTVAIALLTFAAYPIFVTFIEPVVFHEKLKKADIVFSIMMFSGVVSIVPNFDLKDGTTIGLLWGMVGSVTFALMSMLNRSLAGRYDGAIIAFYEQGVAAAVLLPVLLSGAPSPTGSDWVLLVVLGVIFTGVAHSLFIGGMKRVRAQTAGVIASLESVYGILFAALLLGEIPSLREIIGGGLILGAAFCSTLRAAKEQRR